MNSVRYQLLMLSLALTREPFRFPLLRIKFCLTDSAWLCGCTFYEVCNSYINLYTVLLYIFNKASPYLTCFAYVWLCISLCVSCSVYSSLLYIYVLISITLPWVYLFTSNSFYVCIHRSVCLILLYIYDWEDQVQCVHFYWYPTLYTFNMYIGQILCYFIATDILLCIFLTCVFGTDIIL